MPQVALNSVYDFSVVLFLSSRERGWKNRIFADLIPKEAKIIFLCISAFSPIWIRVFASAVFPTITKL